MSIWSYQGNLEGHTSPPGRLAYERKPQYTLLAHPEAVKSRRNALIGWRLGAPLQTGKVWVFAVLAWVSIKLFCFALKATLFLLTLFHSAHFLALSFCERCFAWSSDDVLLGLWHMKARNRVTERRYDVACVSMPLHRRMDCGAHCFHRDASGLPAPRLPWR